MSKDLYACFKRSHALSFQHLLHFLGEAVKVFGGDHLRGTKYLLPVDEAEVLVGELQKLAPSSWKDIASAAKAGEESNLSAPIEEAGRI